MSKPYNEMHIPDAVQLIRDKYEKTAHLSITTTEKWQLYAGKTINDINLSTPLLKGEGSGTFLLDVPTGVRSYFQLETDKEKIILAEKHLPMAGGYNFRDLGGTKTVDGRYVKWGKLFRSDDLHHLTEEDLQYLSSIPLTTVVDFRVEPEIKMAPDKLPDTVKHHYPYSITPGNLGATMDFSSFDDEKSNRVMMEVYVQLVTAPKSIEQYKAFFKLVQNEENLPLLFHCSAGKDRTGLATAYILLALGVDETIVIEDYLLSNTYLKEKYKAYTLKYPALTSLFEVRADFIQHAFQQIRKEYGTIAHYLENILEIDIPKLKEIYLY